MQHESKTYWIDEIEKGFLKLFGFTTFYQSDNKIPSTLLSLTLHPFSLILFKLLISEHLLASKQCQSPAQLIPHTLSGSRHIYQLQLSQRIIPRKRNE